MFTLWDRIRIAFHEPASRSYRLVEGLVWILILLSSALVFLELTAGLDMGGSVTLLWLDRAILVIFAVEISLRVGSFRAPELGYFSFRGRARVWAHIKGRVRFCTQPLNLIDILTVLALFPALRGLRAIRLLRLARSPNWFRYSTPVASIQGAFRDNSLLFGFAFTALGLATALGGITIYFIERGLPGSSINTLGDGLWWAIVTITTVGFGDMTPGSGLGRIVAGVLMISGMFTLAMFAGIVGHTLLGSVLRIREEQFRMSNYIDHVVVCGYNAGARMLLDELLIEHGQSSHDLVIFAPGERQPNVPPAFIWVNGDPTKESELAKARVAHAKAVIIVGSRAVDPQAADAITILTAFTIRRSTSTNPDALRRLKPLYVVAEILETENVDHVRTAGADEVIETTRLGFSLMSHAIAMPGTSGVMSRVASSGAHNLYVTPLPPAYDAPVAFSVLARQFKQDTGALLIGVRHGASDVDHLNPTADFAVGEDHDLLYLAREPVDR